MAERSVGCESCHGPLQAHNAWQNQFGKSGRKDPTVTKPSREQILDYCGFCHARRDELTGDFKPGDRFADDFALVTVDHSDRYYSDGQIRDEDYEYGSFLSSRMYLKGVYCLDCHNPHSYKTTLPGNWLCLRCHDGSNTNAPLINPSTHSHHQVYGFDTNGHPVNVDLTKYNPAEVKETGGQCVNCHMPQTAYMQRHWRHDHGFTSPDPQLTLRYGIPNACNRCHRDQDAKWSFEYCEQWYGDKMDRPARRRAEVVELAKQGGAGAPGQLLNLLAGEESPYWRAVALEFLSPAASQPEVRKALLDRLSDTNALVRAAAARSLEPALLNDDGAVTDALRVGLADPIRAVRLASAWSLRATLDPHSAAGVELARFLANKADQPVGQMQLGVYALSRKEADSAEKYFRQAIAWDPYSPPFYQELAVLYSTLNRPHDAVTILEEACRRSPRDAETRFQLGLACNDAGDLPRARDQLAEAVRLDPRHASAWYNLGLAQDSLGQSDLAVESLLRAESAAPDQARIPYARATILARLGRRSEALTAVRRALEINPSSDQARQLLNILGP
jgi:tetratricopeptide (TPR) repeat protein